MYGRYEGENMTYYMIDDGTIAKNRKSAEAQAKKYRKKYGKGYRVTIKKNKTSKKTHSYRPGVFGPFFYDINIWKITEPHGREWGGKRNNPTSKKCWNCGKVITHKNRKKHYPINPTMFCKK